MFLLIRRDGPADFKEVARQYEPSERTIRDWVKQADLDDRSRNDGLTTDERQELVRLRRGNARLKEGEILSKAAACLATIAARASS